MLVAALVFTAGGLFADATPTIDENGNYVFTVAVGVSETYSSAIEGAIGVIKEGAGKLTLTGANTFTGDIVVNTGTIAAAPSATAGKPAVIVRNGATFDSAGGGVTWGSDALSLSSITIEGDGMDGNGAFIRSSGTACRSPSNAQLKLVGNATVSFKINHNPGAVNLNGYTLTKTGAGNWDAYNCGSSFTLDGDGGKGGIVIKQGAIQFQQTLITMGSSENVLELAGGSYNSYPIAWSVKCPWTLKVTAASTVSSQSAPDVNNAHVIWSGPVEITGGDLTLAHNAANCVFNFEGAVTATGGYGIKSTQGITYFKGSVDLGTGQVTQSADAGLVEFRGNVAQSGTTTGTAYKADKGVSRFIGGSNVSLNSRIGYEYDKFDINTTGRVEVVNVGYFKHGGTTYLSGSKAVPQKLFVTNSTWDGENTTTVVGNNYSWGVLDMQDSVFTNTLRVGGLASDPWGGSYGAVYQRGGAAYSSGNLLLGGGKKTGLGCYIKESGTTGGNNGLLAGDCGFGSAYFLGGNATIMGTSTIATGSDGAGVYYQTGGSTNFLYALQFGKADAAVTNGQAVVALEGQGTHFETDGGTVQFLARGKFNGIMAFNDGATMRTFSARRPSEGGNTKAAYPDAKWYMNFDGGVIKPTWGGEQWGGADYTPNKVIVHEGGMVLDTESGIDFTWKVPLQGATDKIVKTITLPADAAFLANQGLYIAPTKVVITGTGEGAAAIAMFDKATRSVTGIKVVAPGTGYDGTTTATIEAPDRKTNYSCAVTLADAPTSGAGFTKRGSGSYTFDCANTYKGPTLVEGGTLNFVHAEALPSGSGLKICVGATANLGDHDVTVPSLEGAGSVNNGSVTVTDTLKLAMKRSETMSLQRGLTLKDGVEIELSGSVDDLDPNGRNDLLTATTVVCEGSVSLPALPSPWTIQIRNNGIDVHRVIGTMLMFR